MNKKFIYFALLLLGMVSCDADDSDTYSQVSQLARIKSFVESEYVDYQIVDKNIYVVNLDDVTVSGEKIAEGDSVSIYYAIFEFYSSIDDLIFTNIESIADDYSFVIDDMSFDPLKIKYGTTSLYKGMELALNNLTEGGTYIAIFPSDYAYGDKINGVVEGNTSLAVYMYIDDVNKQ